MKGKHMLSLKTLRATGMTALLLATSATTALAADMLGAPPPPPVPMAAPVLGGDSGFYLRGDIGYGTQTYSRLQSHPAAAGTTTRSKEFLRGTLTAGVGMGYQFNSWLRTDATVEYRSPSAMGFRETNVSGGQTYVNDNTGNISAVVALANAYVDLGTWNRFTPFVGAGVGVRSASFRDVRDHAPFGAGATAGVGSYGSAPDKTSTGLAWALHAGVGYDVSSNLKLELGYRYLNMGTLGSSNLNCTNGGTGVVTPCGWHNRVKNWASHDVRFGVRYLFAEAAPAYAPGPLVRKY
jgi:opacity protein-like surface antigen